MKNKLGFVTLLVLTMVSCQRIVDNYWERKAEENYFSPYQGIYAGAYDGADKGTLRIVISQKNTVTVTRISTVNPLTEEFYGGMIDASFNQVKSRTSGFTILGNVISNSQNTFSGTWKIDEGTTGNWTLKKQ